MFRVLSFVAMVGTVSASCIDISGYYDPESKMLRQNGCAGGDGNGWTFTINGNVVRSDYSGATGSIDGGIGSWTISWSNGHVYTQKCRDVSGTYKKPDGNLWRLTQDGCHGVLSEAGATMSPTVQQWSYTAAGNTVTSASGTTATIDGYSKDGSIGLNWANGEHWQEVSRKSSDLVHVGVAATHYGSPPCQENGEKVLNVKDFKTNQTGSICGVPCTKDSDCPTDKPVSSATPQCLFHDATGEKYCVLACYLGCGNHNMTCLKMGEEFNWRRACAYPDKDSDVLV